MPLYTAPDKGYYSVLYGVYEIRNAVRNGARRCTLSSAQTKKRKRGILEYVLAYIGYVYAHSLIANKQFVLHFPIYK